MLRIKHIIIISSLLLWCVWGVGAQRRPVIGISDLYKDGTNAAVPRSYVDAVLQNGGIPVVVPLMSDKEKMVELLNSLDGIIFTGGEDFDPAYYNERPIPQMGTINAPRDEFDISLLLLAAERGLPVLGICRGIQLINIAFGGSLYQDLPAQYKDNSVRHRQRQPKEEASHSVIVESNTVFSNIVKTKTLMVNSSHHQAIKKVAIGFRVAGKSPDNIVEVIEKIDSENWILGVQFHPEVRFTRDTDMRRIFQRFIEETISRSDRQEKDKPLYASRPQVKSEPVIKPQNDNRPAPEPQIIYKSVVDTQYIYKMIVDTQFVYIPADTVYISVIDTQYIQAPTNTIDMLITETKTTSITEDTITDNISNEDKASDYDKVSENVSNRTLVTILGEDSEYVPDTIKRATITIKPASKSRMSASDSLIYTPGSKETPVASINETSKSIEKNEKKEAAKAAKAAKKEKEEKERQYQKDLMERAKLKKQQEKEIELQKKKEQEALKEKEKQEKKEAKEKEKQFQKQQKENAKSDKKELKENKGNGEKEQ